MKTGDVLITFSASYLRGSAIKFTVGCQATHTAMVFERDGELYTIEIYPSWTPVMFKQQDVKIKKLDKFVANSERDTLALVPLDGTFIFTSEDEEYYSKFWYNLWPFSIFEPARRHKVCSTFIAQIYADKGLMSQEEHHSISPCYFFSKPNITFFSR
jgi:hypothetical protein